MLLTIDVGNTQIYVGVLDGFKVVARFRHTSKGVLTSDELGVFLIAALEANKVNIKKIKNIAISSVVPDITRSIIHCAKKYFCLEPFVVNEDIKTKVYFADHIHRGLGADRICDIEGASHLFPNKNLIVIDFGTAITFNAVASDGQYLGGAICAGTMLSMNALASGAALLPTIEVKKPTTCAGLTTITQIQAGLFYGAIGTVKEIVSKLKKECFENKKFIIVGTGGVGRLFENENIFDVYNPDLVLIGLKVLEGKNKNYAHFK